MWQSMFKVAAATGLFAVVHSTLAGRAAKERAARLAGRRNRNGLYRLFYLGQSAATLAVLAAYVRRQDGRELYHVQGPPAWIMRAGQCAALVYATWAARQVGVRRMLGWESFRAWLGPGDVPPEPEAQGPAEAGGLMHVTGPFRWSRHPLNLAPVPVFWLCPRMTTNLLAFNVAATAYLVLGSLHEEERLLAAYGPAYAAYQASGIPFYVPSASARPVLQAHAGHAPTVALSSPS